MHKLINKKILLGITGGIAAYKSADLVRRLREVGAEVKVVMTSAAKEFITPLTMQAVSANPVYQDLFDPAAEAAMGHIKLARWADLILIAPASADFLARLAQGHANDLLTTLCLATTAPIMLAPAMNQQMWLNLATQTNVKVLNERGIRLLGPAEGDQACGEVGPGRMLEPLQIIAEVSKLWCEPFLLNKKIIITAGPTQEPIDPVRYLSNHSSGKMGFALADAAVANGADVTLISGPVNLATPAHVNRINVQTAAEMYAAVFSVINQCDIFISTAAVADYKIKHASDKKIKKNTATMLLELDKNPDILKEVANLPVRPFVVGFAAETDQLIENAKAKLMDKKLDMIAANWVGTKEQGFGSDDNQLTVLWKNGQQILPLMNKKQLAYELIQLIAEHYYAKNST